MFYLFHYFRPQLKKSTLLFKNSIIKHQINKNFTQLFDYTKIRRLSKMSHYRIVSMLNGIVVQVELVAIFTHLFNVRF